MKKFLLSIVLLCLLGVAVQAELAITTANGSGADTYVANDDGSQSPDGNFGTENRMRIRVNGTNRVKIAYIRFDLSNVLLNPTNAYLKFETTYMKSGGKSVNVYGLTDNKLDYWIESGTGGITFNTAPGQVLPAAPGTYTLDTTKTTLLGTFATSTTAAPVILTTSPASLNLADFLRSDTNGLVTLLLIGQDDETELATKENTTAGITFPTLVLPDSNDIVARATAPVPASYATVSTGLNTLSWTNPEPNNPGETITCDVYFGTTEPNVLLPHWGLPLLQAGITGNSVAIPPLAQFKTYYWVVDIHDSSFPDRTVPGFVWVFDTNNAPPVVNAGPDQYVWLTKAVVNTTSDADTYLRDATVRGAEPVIDIRGGGTDFGGYLRFDLSALTAMGPGVLSNARLTLTISGGASRNDTPTNARFALYGLNNVPGNTPQNWSEAVLMDTNTGQEWNGTMPMTAALANGWITDLDDNVAGIVETIGGTTVGSKITISGPPLEAFLKSRIDDNGLATFILANDDGTDRGFGVGSKENANADYRPNLTLTYVPDSASNNGDAAVKLSGTVADDGLPDPPAACTVQWTQVSGPSTVTIDPANTLETTVYLPSLGTYVFRMTADDSNMTGSDTVQIYVGTNPCDAAQNTPGYTANAADFNRDCMVNLKDFAAFAAQWLDCNSYVCP